MVYPQLIQGLLLRNGPYFFMCQYVHLKTTTTTTLFVMELDVDEGEGGGGG